MSDEVKMECCNCQQEIQEVQVALGFYNHQGEYEEKVFDSKECCLRWVTDNWLDETKEE